MTVTLDFDMRQRIPPAGVIFDEVSILTSPGVVMTPLPTAEALVDWAVDLEHAPMTGDRTATTQCLHLQAGPGPRVLRGL